jgi:hypothetical protein
MTKKERDIIVLMGKTGNGKTFLAENFLIENFAKKMPVIIADSIGEYKNGSIFESPEELLKAFRNSLAGEPIPSICIVRIKTDLQAEKLFRLCNRLKFEHCLVVEEASKFCSPHQINDDLNEMIAYGRHYSNNLIFITQRFGMLNRMMTSQADFFISFAQTEHIDLKNIKNYTSDFDVISRLNKREFFSFGAIRESSIFINKLKLNQVCSYNSKTKKIVEV